MSGKVDIINSTLGKALGGASGGYTTGPKELIDLLRQRSRPYLFSNTLPPPVVAGASKVCITHRREDTTSQHENGILSILNCKHILTHNVALCQGTPSVNTLLSIVYCNCKYLRNSLRVSQLNCLCSVLHNQYIRAN